MVPDDDQAIVLPCASVTVIIVLLNVAFTWAMPEAMFLRSRRLTRVASLPILRPFRGSPGASQMPPNLPLHGRFGELFLLARDRLGRSLAGARIGMGTLATDRKAAPMPQPTVAAKVHQPLDVHRRIAAQIALDLVIAVDHFANLQHLLVGELRDPTLVGNSHLAHDFTRLGGTDAVNILQPNQHALIGRNVHSSDTGQSSSPRYRHGAGAADSPFSCASSRVHHSGMLIKHKHDASPVNGAPASLWNL